jgi:hypothetical protein
MGSARPLPDPRHVHGRRHEQPGPHDDRHQGNHGEHAYPHPAGHPDSRTHSTVSSPVIQRKDLVKGSSSRYALEPGHDLLDLASPYAPGEPGMTIPWPSARAREPAAGSVA